MYLHIYSLCYRKFYFLHESFFSFEASLIMNGHTYAFILNDLWFRGIITDFKLTVVEVSVHIFIIDTMKIEHLIFVHINVYQSIPFFFHNFADRPTCLLKNINIYKLIIIL